MMFKYGPILEMQGIYIYVHFYLILALLFKF